MSTRKATAPTSALIERHLQEIQAYVDDGDGKLSLEVLRYCEVCYKALLLNNGESIVRLLKRHRVANILRQAREARDSPYVTCVDAGLTRS